MKTGKYIECEYCGKVIYKTPYQYAKHKHHFCSNKCQAQFKRELTYIHRPCEICGKDMYIQQSSKQRFCSTECQSEWQKSNTGVRNPKFRGQIITCENCGNEFPIGKYKLEHSRHHFCSAHCRQVWFANVWSKAPEWIEISRKRAVSILSTRMPTTMTKPQETVNAILDSLNIKYINEMPFVYYSVDNYLTENNLIIEVMGDYWHSSPLKYSNKTNDKQKHIISRDRAKHTYIKNEYGIEILYLWEDDIVNNPDLCRHLIIEYCDNKGAMGNYNSFNYSLDCGVIKLNDKIIKSQIERTACRRPNELVRACVL